MKYRYSCALGLLLMAGCATSIPTLAPNAGVEAPSSWARSVPGGSAPLAQWWRVFGDPLLVQLVEDAARANTDIAVARANLRAARAARDEAAAALWPSLSLGAQAQRSRASGGASDRNNFQAGLDAGWELDLFGANAHAARAQESLVQASAATLAQTQVSIAAEVALAYLDLRGAQARIAVARENLANQQETLQISQWRAQAGLANAVEVEQATTAVEQTRASLPTLAKAEAQAAHALGVLTGRTPQALLSTLAAAAPLPQAKAGVEVNLPAAVLRERADVLAAEARLRAAAERVGAADAARKPRIALDASVGWSAGTLGNLGSIAAARSLLVSLTQPLFDAGRLRAQLTAREAEFDAAQASYRASVLGALQEVEDALVALSASREREAALERALESARTAALLASQRHASGLIDFQTVLETQRTLLNVQDSVTSAQAEVAAAHVRLYKALGGGWSAAGVENAS